MVDNVGFFVKLNDFFLLIFLKNIFVYFGGHQVKFRYILLLL